MADEMLTQTEVGRPEIFDLAERLPRVLLREEVLDALRMNAEEFDKLPIPYIGVSPRARRWDSKSVFQWIWENRTLHEGWSAYDLLGPGATLQEMQKAWDGKNVCTYFIGASETAPPAIKIGRASHPLSRMAELQVGNHHELKLWAIRRGDCEKFYHRKYREYRIRNTEWFRLSWGLAQEIRRWPFADGERP